MAVDKAYRVRLARVCRLVATTLAGIVLAGSLGTAAKDLLNTRYRELPASRSVSDLDVDDFFDNMESGFFTNLQKTGPASFEFDLQQTDVYGPQGTLRVWFYAMCDLRNVKVAPGDRLRMAVRWPIGNTYMRPVFSYDAVDWNLVPDGWGRADEHDTRYRFDVPLTPGHDRVYFAAHYPYPSHRVLERALSYAGNRYVRTIGVIGRTERDRPILRMTITDPANLTAPWQMTRTYRRETHIDRMVHEDCEGEERNPIVDGKFTLAPPP